MKYPNIKAAHLSHAQIAKAFGYANVKSFRTSSAHQRHMRGVETILQIVFNTSNLVDFKILIDPNIAYTNTKLNVPT